MVELSLHIALDPDEMRRNFIGQARSVNLSAWRWVWLRGSLIGWGKMEQLRAVFIDFMGFLKNISLTAQKITLNS